MNIFDSVFAGEVVMRSEVFWEVRVFFTNRRYTRLLVAKRWGKYRIVFKTVETSFGIPCVSYSVVRESGIQELRARYPDLRPWLDKVGEQGLITQ